MYAAGKYQVGVIACLFTAVQPPPASATCSQMTISDVVAKGTYSIEAPSRSLVGTVFVDASRVTKADPWNFASLNVEFDAAAVAAANAARDEVARRAGYGESSGSGQGTVVTPGAAADESKLVVRII